MKITERVNSFIQPLKTSFGTAATKASETVKKASEIASKILKVLFSPVTYLYQAVKSLLNRVSKNPAPAAQPEDSILRQSDAADLDRTAAALKIQAVNRGHNARNILKAKKAKKAEKAAVKIQVLGRDYIARKLQKAEKAEKAKAEVFRPTATAVLANITQQAVAQYANRTQVSHRTPTSLTKATSIKTAPRDI